MNGVDKRDGDAKMEGQRTYIRDGTDQRSVYKKEKVGAPKKPPLTYLHVQIESGAHRVGRTPGNVNRRDGWVKGILRET